MNNPQNRPLSPHLQVYDMFRFTSFTSVMHRATGIVCSIGMLFIAWWLVSAASGEATYLNANKFLAHPLVVFCLFGWTGCLWYHFFNGIRHLLWDFGKTLNIPAARKTMKIAVFMTALMNVGMWLIIWSVL